MHLLHDDIRWHVEEQVRDEENKQRNVVVGPMHAQFLLHAIDVGVPSGCQVSFYYIMTWDFNRGQNNVNLHVGPVQKRRQ